MRCWGDGVSGRWSPWALEQTAHVRRWSDGTRTVEVRVTTPPDALPLLPASDPWRWSVSVDGREVRVGEIPAGTPAPQLYAPFHAMQAGREMASQIDQNGMSSSKSPAGGAAGAARELAFA